MSPFTRTPMTQEEARALLSRSGGTDEEMLKSGVITTSISKVVDLCRKNSLWPMPMGISCCAIEMMAIVGSRYDVARFGAEAMRFSPRQCDLMIVAGTLTQKMAPAVRRIYEQMPEPKWVIAMGACLVTGGMFNSYPVVQGLDKVIPVDVYVPGCPPRPEALIYAIMKIQEKISRERIPLRGERDPQGNYRPGQGPYTVGSMVDVPKTGLPGMK
jgi:NADH-quinone oxidoreductase subunit B